MSVSRSKRLFYLRGIKHRGFCMERTPPSGFTRNVWTWARHHCGRERARDARFRLPPFVAARCPFAARPRWRVFSTFVSGVGFNCMETCEIPLGRPYRAFKRSIKCWISSASKVKLALYLTALVLEIQISLFFAPCKSLFTRGDRAPTSI